MFKSEFKPQLDIVSFELQNVTASHMIYYYIQLFNPDQSSYFNN